MFDDTMMIPTDSRYIIQAIIFLDCEIKTTMKIKNLIIQIQIFVLLLV